jgi:hypothetical protein
MKKANIDTVQPKKSLIDLDRHSEGAFGFENDYSLTHVFDDILLVEFTDVADDDVTIIRGGLHVPLNALTKAWRIGKVAIAGAGVELAKQGDTVVFPNDKGVTVANIDVEGYGKVKNGIFLNERRLFGIIKPK